MAAPGRPDGARHYGIVRMPQKFANEGFGSCICPTAQIVNRFGADLQIRISQQLADSGCQFAPRLGGQAFKGQSAYPGRWVLKQWESLGRPDGWARVFQEA